MAQVVGPSKFQALRLSPITSKTNFFYSKCSMTKVDVRHKHQITNTAQQNLFYLA
jgi:hypothetical protein